MDLEYTVDKQIVTRTDKNKSVNWSDDYLQLCFDFVSSDWTGAGKFILVFDGDEVYRFGLVNDKFLVPEELLTGKKLVFSVYGVTDSYRITTPKILVHLLEAGYDENVSELDVDEFTHDVVEEVYLAISNHTHTKSQITDFSHTHDDRYYTETEVNTLLTDLKNNIENKIQLKVDKTIIQDDDTTTLTAKVKMDGFVVSGATINFYDIGDE